MEFFLQIYYKILQENIFFTTFPTNFN